jgi:hypothetical protein
MQARKYMLPGASFMLNLAMSISLAKGWANRFPDSLILALYAVACLPFLWWLYTHEKLLIQRQWIRIQFRDHPLSSIVVCGLFLFTIIFSGTMMERRIHESPKERTVTFAISMPEWGLAEAGNVFGVVKISPPPSNAVPSHMLLISRVI